LASTVAYNARLRHERAIAQAQRDAAKTAQQQSEADFRLALDAVQRFYTEVSENKLLNVPTMDPLRIELLERARDFYGQIARERADDPVVQAGWARAGWRLAVMVFDARSVQEGISLLAGPIAIQERLVERYPDRPEFRSDLARSYNNLGIMHRRNNQNALGGEDWERALALRDRLVQEHPDDFLYRRDLGQTRLNLGNWYRTECLWGRAEESYRSALTIFAGLADEAPDSSRARTDLPVTPFTLDAGRIRYDLAFTYFNLGVMLRDIGRTAEAAEGFTQALDRLVRLVHEQPSRTIFRSLLAKTHYELGVLLAGNGQTAQATDLWLKSRELFAALVREHPDNWGFRYNLALNLRSLSLVADATGRAGEAEATRRSAREIEEKLVREHSESSDYYYLAALVYLRFAAKVVADGTSKSPVVPTTFAEECAGHAISMLKEAEKAGYFGIPEGIKLLESDDHLDSLRSRDGFRQLLARVLRRRE
jgi:eukaryotic-like serine/threonine-protein kinase